MGKQFSKISDTLKDFISQRKVFFVGTAAAEGRVNVSPKGMDTLRVAGSNKVVWLNLTGSGNETAAHLLKDKRMTIMFCAFEGNPLILRLYGTARIYHPRDTEYQEHIGQFEEVKGARQIVVMDVEMVQTSCGFGVPVMEFREERSQLRTWAEKKGPEGIEQYWDTRNRQSIDGFETGILD